MHPASGRRSRIDHRLLDNGQRSPSKLLAAVAHRFVAALKRTQLTPHSLRKVPSNADPWKWQDELDEWSGRWPDRIVQWPTNSNRRMAPAIDRFRTALEEGRITHNGVEDLARHMLNARLRKVGRDADGRGLCTLEKAGSGRLIDACVASVLANEAAAQIEDEEPPPKLLAAWA